MTGWWLGASVYDWGYLPYYNPYYTQSYTFGPTSSTTNSRFKPSTMASQPTAANVPAVSPEATQHADAARQAFYDQDYRRAMSEIDQALGLMPGDPAFHELQSPDSVCHGRVPAAAAAVHSLLAVGPGWDWTTMIGLYANEDIYTKQLRALEIFRRDHPNDAAARFLLAYHYLTMGHTRPPPPPNCGPSSNCEPQDRVAAQLLQMITSRGPTRKDQRARRRLQTSEPPPAETRQRPAHRRRRRSTEPGRPAAKTAQRSNSPDPGWPVHLAVQPGGQVAPVQRHGHRRK